MREHPTREPITSLTTELAAQSELIAWMRAASSRGELVAFDRIKKDIVRDSDGTTKYRFVFLKDASG